MHEAGSEDKTALEPKAAYLYAAPSADDYEAEAVDWHRDYFGTNSGETLDEIMVIKARALELKIVQPQRLDDEKPTADRPGRGEV